MIIQTRSNDTIEKVLADVAGLELAGLSTLAVPVGDECDLSGRMYSVGIGRIARVGVGVMRRVTNGDLRGVGRGGTSTKIDEEQECILRPLPQIEVKMSRVTLPRMNIQILHKRLPRLDPAIRDILEWRQIYNRGVS